MKIHTAKSEPVPPSSGKSVVNEERIAWLMRTLDEMRNEISTGQPPVAALLSQRHDVGFVLRGFVITDVAALALAYFAAWIFAAAMNAVFLGRSFSDPFVATETPHLIIFLAITCGMILWFAQTGHYRMRKPFWLETRIILNAAAFALLLDGFMQFAVKQDFSRVWLMSRWVLAAVGILVFRGWLRSFLRRKGLWQVRTLLVGHGATANEARAALKSDPSLGYDIVAQISGVGHALREAGGSWNALLAQHGADYVIVALDGNDLAEGDRFLEQLMRENIPFSLSPPMKHLPVFGMEPHYFFNHNVMLLARNNRLAHLLPRLIKRSFDMVASGIALLLLSPVFLMLAFWVKTDGGPAFFPNRRLGADGKSFDCLKFRSMVLDADRVLADYFVQYPEARAEWDSHKKLRGDDPRVTSVGRFLRKTSLDELPQLLNVLLGDMSLVGPRPILLRELDDYGQDIAHYYRLRPGLTGLWQVNGRNNVTYRERVQMDSWYVRNWSLWHDIVILFKTIPVIVNRKGAF